MSFGRIDRGGRSEPMGEINMTPLIDVMMVLLVIFMVTAPLMSNSLQLDLPRSEAAKPQEVDKPLILALDVQGRLYLGEQRIEWTSLAARAADVARDRPRTEVQLKADQAVPYGRVVELIGVLQTAGLSRIAFVADTPGAGRNR